MTPNIALIVFLIGILGLFALNRYREAQTSKALWIPVVWVSISGSRMVSQWLAVTGLMSANAPIDQSAQLLEGSPLDRFLLSGIVLLSVIVLIGRGRQVGAVLRRNWSILIFFIFCLISVLWSDYPDVAFKRWIKAVGDIAIVLIVLTDLDPSAAIERFLTRVGFVLVPMSVLLIRYYGDLGRAYNPHFGTYSIVGVCTGKNELGIVCLVFGIGSVWLFCRAFQAPQGIRRTGPLVAHTIFLAMVFWLLWMANSMTSIACLLIASTLIVATRLPVLARKPRLVHPLVATMMIASFSALFLNIGSSVLDTMGRDSSLTGRTGIWDLVLGMTGNPLIGAGFESFWLGTRLDKIWNVYWWHPNEAHNGYVEVYLNLGWIGVTLLGIVMVTGYRNVVGELRRNSDLGGLRLAYFVTGVVYNFTESAIRIMHPVWILFILAVVVVPDKIIQEDPPPLAIYRDDNFGEREMHTARVPRVGLRRESV